MKYIQNAFAVGILFCLGLTLNAQNSLKGTLSEHPGESADILTGFMNPTVVGTIEKDGSFEITFPENYVTDLLSTIENQDKNDKFTMSLQTVNRAFGNCSEGNVEIENGDEPVINFTTQNSFMVGNIEKQKKYGYLMASNTREFANSMMTYEHGTDEKGYYLDWYYFEQPVSVKGQCSIKSYTLTQTEEDAFTKITIYDLNFKKGWNIVKYENETIHNDSENKSYASKILFQTIEEMPKDFEFIFLEKN